MNLNLALFCLVAAVGLQATSAVAVGSPVEQIVNLLKTLKDTTVSDGKHEQQIYDKYACWCETTSGRKASDINQGQADLRSLGQRILKLKGTVATRAAEIAEATEAIESNEQEQEQLTAVREKQNGNWAASSAETKQALAALQSAITVLADATAPGASAFIQENQQMRMKLAVTTVLDKLPSNVGLPSAGMVLLSEFTKGKTAFAPQSATIQGMLGDMYLTFANNLESDTSEEADRNADYEQLNAALEKENNQLKDTRARKESEKAKAEAMLADTTKAYEDTEKQMKADIEFFDQTKAACQSKSDEWDVRKEMRSQEVEGIDAALDILTSDENRALFDKSIKPGVANFLQISSSAPASRAYETLKAQVKKSHSVRLAALAVQIRTSKAGHFDKVIKDIDLMLKTLADEGAADLDKKTQCLDEYQDITKTVKDLDWKIKNNVAEIENLEQLIELRTSEKDAANEKIKETNQYIKDITDERKAENEAYIVAKDDDDAAINVLDTAKAAMAKFYKKNGVKMGAIQGAAKGAVLAQDEPVFERSEDDAPDASFSGKGKNKNASKNILSLFSYIIEDLTNELIHEKKTEAQSQADFEKESATAEQLVSDLEEKVVTLEGIIATRVDDKKDENKDMKENNVDRDAELKYQAKITPDCDWIIKAFDGRADARAAEAGGLTTAKEFLAGKTSLIQSEHKFDDSKLSSLGFLGVAH